MKPFPIFIRGSNVNYQQMGKYISGIILFLVTSCDNSSPLRINEGTVYTMHNSCGLIEFRASTFSTGITIYQDFKAGDYKLYIDSLKLIISPPSLASIESMAIYNRNGEEITTTNIEVRPGDRISLHLALSKPIYSINGTLSILPCSYITCFGNPLITDTVQIKF